jgi:hypothetical protein
MLTHLGDKHFACTYPVCCSLVDLLSILFLLSKRHVKIHFILNLILIDMFERYISVEVIRMHVHFRIVGKILREMIR